MALAELNCEHNRVEITPYTHASTILFEEIDPVIRAGKSLSGEEIEAIISRKNQEYGISDDEFGLFQLHNFAIMRLFENTEQVPDPIHREVQHHIAYLCHQKHEETVAQI